MPIDQNVFTLSGTAPVQIADRTVDAQNVWVQNLQPPGELADYARAGYLWLISQLFTVANNNSAVFSCTTGDTGLQIESYQITTSVAPVYAQLIEGATEVVTTGTAVPAYNMNRNYADDYNAVLEGVTSYTGGTVVAAEFLSASNQASGGMDSSKIFTLEPNTEYIFDFENVGNQETRVFFQMAFAEQYNGHHHVWLGTPDSSVKLRGGESVQLDVFPYESILGASTGTATKVATFRQD